MKRYIKVIACVVLLTCVTGVFSYAIGVNQEYIEAVEVLKNNDILEEELITRQDCVVSIMKILGVTNKMNWNLDPRYRPVFDDCYSNNAPYYGYLVYAYDNGIIYGTVKNDTEWIFEPNRYTTYTEALTFIVRCLAENPADVREYALNMGILKESDEFYNILDDYITKDEFYVLLGRMLKCKCYVYAGDGIDNVQSKTYAEILEERNALGISVKGYALVEMLRDSGGRKVVGDLYE